MKIMATSDLHGNLEGLDPKGHTYSSKSRE